MLKKPVNFFRFLHVTMAVKPRVKYHLASKITKGHLASK